MRTWTCQARKLPSRVGFFDLPDYTPFFDIWADVWQVKDTQHRTLKAQFQGIQTCACQMSVGAVNATLPEGSLTTRLTYEMEHTERHVVFHEQSK